MLHPARGISAVFGLIVACLAASAASAQAQQPVQTLGGLSFAVPDGWRYEHTPGEDFANMAWKNANGAFAIIVMTEPVVTSGSLEKDFAAAWRARWSRIHGSGCPRRSTISTA